jgi:hypothetical protein
MSQATKPKSKLSSRKMREKAIHATRKSDSLPAGELAALAMGSGAFDWLSDPAEEIYTTKDGKKASWPSKRTNGAV